ncbi:GNAT family N-acetyltransferase [Luedemannella flava]
MELRDTDVRRPAAVRRGRFAVRRVPSWAGRPHLVWFLAVHTPAATATGGLRLSRRGGPTGRDVIGESATVQQLSVDPAHQRAGVGTALMRAAEGWLRDRPNLPRTISLGVETTNAAAIALYSRLGYVVTSRDGVPITFVSGDNHLCQVMVKRL